MVRDTINRVKSDEDLRRHDESNRQELYNVRESEMCFGIIKALNNSTIIQLNS
jgi:hypothetical protein